MGLSHPISLKVADLSNTMRMTSFTHYRTVISLIDTGGLCALSTKPSRGSILHTSETNYTLKGRWHMNAERSFLQGKAFVQCERSTNPTSKKGRGWGWRKERRENLWHISLALPLGCRMHLPGAHKAGGETKMGVWLQGTVMLRTKNRQHSWHTH